MTQDVACRLPNDFQVADDRILFLLRSRGTRRDRYRRDTTGYDRSPAGYAPGSPSGQVRPADSYHLCLIQHVHFPPIRQSPRGQHINLYPKKFRQLYPDCPDVENRGFLGRIDQDVQVLLAPCKCKRQTGARGNGTSAADVFFCGRPRPYQSVFGGRRCGESQSPAGRPRTSLRVRCILRRIMFALARSRSPSPRITLMMVANSGFPSAESALHSPSRASPMSRAVGSMRGPPSAVGEDRSEERHQAAQGGRRTSAQERRDDFDLTFLILPHLRHPSAYGFCGLVNINSSPCQV